MQFKINKKLTLQTESNKYLIIRCYINLTHNKNYKNKFI